MPANNFQAMLKAAVDNIAQVAEAEARLAAAGQVSLSTWRQSADAIHFLTSEMKRMQAAAKGGAGQPAKGSDAEAKKATAAVQELRRATLAFTVAATASTVSLRQFTGAASPQLLGALNTSIETFSAKIGGQLLPVLDSVIDFTQDASEWFDNLGDGQKKLVAGAVVAVPAVVGLATAARALTPAATMAAAAVQKFAAAAKANQALAIGGGVVGSAAAIYGAFKLIEAFNDSEKDKLRDERSKTGRVSAADIREANKTSVGFLGDPSRKSDEEFARLSKDDQQKYFLQRATHIRNQLANVFPRLPGERAMMERSAATFERAAKEGAENPEEEIWRRRVTRQAMRTEAATRENRPQYNALVDARRQLQLQALGKNPFEQQLLKEQREHRIKEEQQLAELIRIGKERGFRLAP